MNADCKFQAVQGVQGLRPYQPGKPIDELARELGLNEKDIIKLASNENPLGPSDKALDAIRAEMADLARYPDGAGFELKQALCDKLGIQQQQITLGNGSSDILDFMTRVFVNDGDNVVVSQHAFSIYGLVAKAVGADVITASARNYCHDLDAMASAVNDRTRIVFVTNPNNPTGTWLAKAELVNFLNSIPERVLVVLDEAYFEYVSEAEYPNGIELLPDYPNLIITRTFSKAYGLASLRVGYGISSPEIADLLNRVRPPFNVDSFALAAAKASLSDDEYVRRSVAENSAGMALLTGSFKRLKLEYIPSVGNFVSFKVHDGVDAMSVYQALLHKGLIVRPIASYEMPDYLRVSIGTDRENQRFVQALEQVLGELA